MVQRLAGKPLSRQFLRCKTNALFHQPNNPSMLIRSFSIPFILLAALLLNYEHGKPETRQVKVQINKGSYLIAHGRTNLTKFHCQYIKSLSDTLLVMITRDERNKLILKNAEISLSVMEFDCGNKLITKDFRKLLQASDFPELKVEAIDIQSTKSLHENQNPEQYQSAISSAKISVTIAGRQHDYQLEIREPVNSHRGIYSGTLHVNIRDFGLVPPRKMLGLMKVNEKVDIDFYLNLSFSD